MGSLLFRTHSSNMVSIEIGGNVPFDPSQVQSVLQGEGS
jgi:hypothetical protein